jgi:antitoxin HicB
MKTVKVRKNKKLEKKSKKTKNIEELVEYYMSLPYKIEITPDEDGGFVAEVKELKGCITQADTLEELFEMIEDAKRGWLEVAIEEGFEIPLPEVMEEEKYSGRILVRLPKYLHRELVENAKKEGVSLNTYIVSLLSKENAKNEIIRELKEVLDKKDS